MIKKILYPSFLILFLCCQSNNLKNDLIYLKKGEAVDIYHGQQIVDSYRALENMNDSLVLKWFRNQNKITENTLQKIQSKQDLFERIQHKDTSAVISKIRITYEDQYFYLKKNFTDIGAKLYMRRGLKGEEKLLFDPKNYKSNSDQSYYINYIKPSWNGKHIAISISKNDEEISEIIVLNTEDRTINPNVIKNSWAAALGGIHWLSDNSGFFYEYIPVVDKSAKDYILNIETVLYKLDDNSEKLKVYFSKKNNPELKMNPEDFPEILVKNQHDKYIFSDVAGPGPFYDYYYIMAENINNAKIDWKPLFKKEDKMKAFEVDGDDIIFLTAKGASNYQICKTSLINPNIDSPEVLVNEDITATITDFVLTKKGLFFVKTKNGVEAKLYCLKDGKIREVPIPNSAGFINLISKSPKYHDLWIETRGWTSKKKRYRYNSAKNKFILEELNKTNNSSNFENIIIKEIEIPSHDGALVPLSLIYNKNIKLNSSNRVLLHGYGAYGLSRKPKMDGILVNWVKNGGIYAVAHVRGGGEKGDIWHKGGFKTTKPNTWKDFIACTEYLLKEKYTSPDKIAVWSASAGGILIGRAITERPDLYAAAIIRVGKLNTVRSENTPNGLNGAKEYGTVKDSIEFKALLEMDAYHNIKKGEKYPAVLLTAGMNDTRVPAWQPAKFAAQMQEANNSKKPILLKVDFNSGHGFDANLEKKQEELANILSFALWQTGHPKYQLKQ